MFMHQIVLIDVIQKGNSIVLKCYELDENFNKTYIEVPYYGSSSVASLSASKGLPIRFIRDNEQRVVSIPLDLEH